MPKEPLADVMTKRSQGDKWVKVGALWHHNSDGRTGIKMIALPVEGMCWAFPTISDPPLIQGEMMCKLEPDNDFRTRIGFVTTSEKYAEGYKTRYTLVFDALPIRLPAWIEVAL